MPLYPDCSDAWNFGVDPDDVPEVKSDEEALAIFRQTPFLHVGVKDAPSP